MSTLQMEVTKSLEGLSDESLGSLLEIINKYMKNDKYAVSEKIKSGKSNKRISCFCTGLWF